MLNTSIDGFSVLSPSQKKELERKRQEEEARTASEAAQRAEAARKAKETKERNAIAHKKAVASLESEMESKIAGLRILRAVLIILIIIAALFVIVGTYIGLDGDWAAIIIAYVIEALPAMIVFGVLGWGVEACSEKISSVQKGYKTKMGKLKE